MDELINIGKTLQGKEEFIDKFKSFLDENQRKKVDAIMSKISEAEAQDKINSKKSKKSKSAPLKDNSSNKKSSKSSNNKNTKNNQPSNQDNSNESSKPTKKFKKISKKTKNNINEFKKKTNTSKYYSKHHKDIRNDSPFIVCYSRTKDNLK